MKKQKSLYERTGSSCSSIQIVDPFSGDNIELGERAKRAVDVEDGDYEGIFKSVHDALLAKKYTYSGFLLKASGDYDDKEYEAIRLYIEKA